MPSLRPAFNLASENAIYFVGLLLYILGFWLHVPYGGGHVYSDIVTVFQSRECTPTCTLGVPYVQTFVEYPVVTSMFMYAMGQLGRLTGVLINGYYSATFVFLAIPTFLAVRETIKIARITGVDQSRILPYFVATPTFVFMLLENWYIIGVFFLLLSIRKFLEGGRAWSGVAMGLSAASSGVTAVPLLALLLKCGQWKERALLLAGCLMTFGLVNLPFLLLNPALWFKFWSYHSNWYIEGSWMLAIVGNESPLRHYIFPALFLSLAALIVWKGRGEGGDPLTLSFLFMGAFLFSTYVYTPQMNLILAPLIALVPKFRRYVAFIAFDTINSLIIVVGFSQPLLPFFTFHVEAFGYWSPIQWMAIARSFMLGAIVVFGIAAWLGVRRRPQPAQPGSSEPSQLRP